MSIYVTLRDLLSPSLKPRYAYLEKVYKNPVRNGEVGSNYKEGNDD